MFKFHSVAVISTRKMLLRKEKVFLQVTGHSATLERIRARTPAKIEEEAMEDESPLKKC